MITTGSGGGANAWASDTKARRATGGASRQVHSPKAITNRYNIAVTVTVSMSGGCICAGRRDREAIHRLASHAPRRKRVEKENVPRRLHQRCGRSAAPRGPRRCCIAEVVWAGKTRSRCRFGLAAAEIIDQHSRPRGAAFCPTSCVKTSGRSRHTLTTTSLYELFAGRHRYW